VEKQEGDAIVCKQKNRKFPIPKQINLFILNKYGLAFYGSKIYAEKLRILNLIMDDLKVCGFMCFGVADIERRLKNMKSHYKRKREDLSLGISQKIEWEYYGLLDTIFRTLEAKEQILVPKTELPISQSTTNASQNVQNGVNAVNVAAQAVKQEMQASSDVFAKIQMQKRKINQTYAIEKENFVQQPETKVNNENVEPIDM
jgi:D-ribose pyranose/furanose isomerase RbsD